MTPARKTLILLASAIPTLLLAAWACWILSDFLDRRSCFGTWRFTVHDAKGTDVAHGEYILTIDSYGPVLSHYPPFLRIKPYVNETSGMLTVTPAGAGSIAAAIRKPWPGRTYPLENMSNNNDLRLFLPLPDGSQLLMDIPNHGGTGSIRISPAHAALGLTLTATVDR